jgi:hypothetical protein
VEASALFQRGYKLALLLYASPSSSIVTRTVRVTDDGASALPLLLTRNPSTSVKVTAFAIGPGRAYFGPAAPLALPLPITWTAGGTSSYRPSVDAALAQTPEKWLTQSSGAAALFNGWGTTPRGEPIPSLVDTYFTRAVGYSAASACIARAKTRTGAAPIACPRGTLLKVDDGTCTEGPDAEAYRCGATVDDLALALSSYDPRAVWLTRAYGIIPAATFGEDVRVSFGGSTATPPVVRADRYEICSDGGGLVDPGGGSGGGGGLTPPPPGNGGGGSWSQQPSDPYYPPPSAGASCGGSTSSSYSSNDDCSGDTSSSSSSDEGDDCDSSSSSSSSSDDCESGSEDYSGDDCSSGSSDYSDDDCDTGSSSGGGEDCSVAKKAKKKGKSPLSRWAVGAAVVLMFLRRRYRPSDS